MREWFRQLALREQMILGAGAVVAVLLIGFSFIYQPLNARTAQLRESVDELSHLLVDIRRAAPLGSGAGAVASSASGASLLSIVPDSGRSYGLIFDTTRLDGQDAIRVTFGELPFDSLNEWLTELELGYGIRVDTVSSISASGTPGHVGGQILLVRAPS